MANEELIESLKAVITESKDDWKTTIVKESFKQGIAAVILLGLLGTAIYFGPSIVTALDKNGDNLESLTKSVQETGTKLENIGKEFKSASEVTNKQLELQTKYLVKIETATDRARKDIVTELKSE